MLIYQNTFYTCLCIVLFFIKFRISVSLISLHSVPFSFLLILCVQNSNTSIPHSSFFFQINSSSDQHCNCNVRLYGPDKAQVANGPYNRTLQLQCWSEEELIWKKKEKWGIEEFEFCTQSMRRKEEGTEWSEIRETLMRNLIKNSTIHKQI